MRGDGAVFDGSRLRRDVELERGVSCLRLRRDHLSVRAHQAMGARSAAASVPGTDVYDVLFSLLWGADDSARAGAAEHLFCPSGFVNAAYTAALWFMCGLVAGCFGSGVLRAAFWMYAVPLVFGMSLIYVSVYIL